MGWWKCNEHGGIDWDARTHSRVHGGLINALPGMDTIENFYNGDGPADAMYVPTAILKSWFTGRDPKPTTEQLTKLFIEKSFDNVFRHIDKNKLNELVDMTWKEIDAIYKEAWGRPAYPEERGYICSFSLSGADGRAKTPSEKRKDRAEWWSISKLDKTYINNFNEGKWPYWWHTS